MSVALAGGAVVAFAAFAKRGPRPRRGPEGASEAEARVQAARLAVADAMRIPADGLPVAPGKTEGLMLVTHAGKQIRVQTARQKTVVVATTVCEFQE